MLIVVRVWKIGDPGVDMMGDTDVKDTLEVS